MTFNPEKHHRRSIRLSGYDYSRPGNYYITIFTQNRECILGEIKDNKIELNDIGQIVEDTWNDLPNHNKNVILDLFIIMPNHVHGIISIVGAGSKPAPNIDTAPDINNANKPMDIVGAGSKPALNINPAPNIDRADLYGADLESAPTGKNHSLSEIIRQFKTFSTRHINEKHYQQGIPIWQRNYYEHIIRDQDDLDRWKLLGKRVVYI